MWGQIMINKVTLGRNEVLALAKVMYEVKGNSLKEIGEVFGVSHNAVKKWKQREGWADRKSKLPEVVEITRQKFLDTMAQKGMPPERAADLLIQGMTEPMTGQILAEPDKKGGQVEVLHPGTADYKARQKHLHDYLVLAGLIGNNGNGMQVNNSADGTVNIQVNIPTKEGESREDYSA